MYLAIFLMSLVQEPQFVLNGILPRYSLDGERICVCSNDSIRLFDLNSGMVILEAAGDFAPLSYMARPFSPDGLSVAHLDRNESLVIREVRTLKVVNTISSSEIANAYAELEWKIKADDINVSSLFQFGILLNDAKSIVGVASNPETGQKCLVRLVKTELGLEVDRTLFRDDGVNLPSVAVASDGSDAISILTRERRHNEWVVVDTDLRVIGRLANQPNENVADLRVINDETIEVLLTNRDQWRVISVDRMGDVKPVSRGRIAGSSGRGFEGSFVPRTGAFTLWDRSGNNPQVILVEIETGRSASLVRNGELRRLFATPQYHRKEELLVVSGEDRIIGWPLMIGETFGDLGSGASGSYGR